MTEKNVSAAPSPGPGSADDERIAAKYGEAFVNHKRFTDKHGDVIDLFYGLMGEGQTDAECTADARNGKRGARLTLELHDDDIDRFAEALRALGVQPVNSNPYT